MANKYEILKILEKTDRKLSLKPMDIARQAGVDENPRVISVQLHRLAGEGFIKKKGSKSGWYITELGKLRLNISKRQPEKKKPPEPKSKWAIELDKQIEIEMSRKTTYGLFLDYGKKAAMVTKTGSRLVLLGAEYAVHGNLQDLEWIKQAFDQMGLPQRFKKIWFNNWASWIKKFVPSQRGIPYLD